MHDIEPDEDDEPPFAWAEELIADGWAPMNHPPHNEEVEAHIERCFGKTETVLHEVLSKHVHIDINVIPPSHGRRFTTYVTSGMSDLPMKAPESHPEWSRIELVIALPGPPTSDRHREPTGDEHYLIQVMRRHARYPHAEDAWLFFHHTIASSETGAPMGSDTAMSSCLLTQATASPIVAADEAFRMTLSSGEAVFFAALVPIHADELAFKREHGGEALEDRLMRAGVTELWDPARPSVIPPRRRGFGWKRLLGRPT